MKKQIIALFIMTFMAAGLAAETGYKGINWGSSEFIIESKEGEETNPLSKAQPGYITKVYEKQLLGEKTNLFYILQKDYGLICIYYSTPKGNTRKLKSNLKNKNLVGTIKYPSIDVSTLKEKIKQQVPDDADRLVEWLAGFTLMHFPLGLETEYRYKWPNLEGDGLISIYDYNDDTRIYIFENIILEKTVVVYFPHEEDY